MFGRIAGRYDLLNRVLSMGIDQRWRKRTVEAAGEVRGKTVVDVCCGTGDLALAFTKAGARVVGVDFTWEMLPLMKGKVQRAGGGCGVLQGDALRLPVSDGGADVASVSFGIRNVADRVAGLRELARVVRPGGRVLVLEFTMPPGAILSRAYRFYFTGVLPRLGGLLSGDRSAYEYLPDTVLAWPRPDELEAELRGVGLVDTGHQLLSRGIACLHWGTVPEAAGER